MSDYYRDDDLRAYAERLRVAPVPKLWPISDHILGLLDDVDKDGSALDTIADALTKADIWPVDDDGVTNDQGTVDGAVKLAGQFDKLRSVMSPAEGDDDNTIEDAPEIDLLHPSAPAKLRAMVTRHVELERFRDSMIAAIVKFGAMAPPPPDATDDARRRVDATALQMLRLLLP